MGLHFQNLTVPLASWHFFLFAVFGVTAFRLKQLKPIKNLVLLLINSLFLYFFLPNQTSLFILVGFLLCCYVLAGISKHLGLQKSFKASFLIFSAFFILLLMIKNHDFLSAANPFAYLKMPIYIVGISYMVFRGLSYIIDIELIENRGFVSYLNYMLFFPTLLSGPIARFEHFQASIDKEPENLEFKTQLMILNRIANGFLKKYVLADNLFVFTQYSNITVLAQQNMHHQVATPMFWLGALLNLTTIYFDFSGYCDIAIGIGQLMGVSIPENFDAPFSARDLQEFWGRWHMSLTNFIKDYVFTPLVRVALFSAPVSMRWFLITACYAFSMILISLWHGTTVNCLLFGVVQATALVMIQIRKRLNMKPLPVPVSCLATYCFMSFTIWVGTLPDNQLLPVLKKMFGMGGFN